MKFVNNFKVWAMNECSEFEEKRKTAYIKSGMGDIDWRYHWHSYGNKIIILDMETGKTGTARCKEDDEFSSIIGVGGERQGNNFHLVHKSNTINL